MSGDQISVREMPEALQAPVALAEGILLAVINKLIGRSDEVSSEIGYCENHVMLIFHVPSEGTEAFNLTNERIANSLEVIASSIIRSPVKLSVQLATSGNDEPGG